MTDSSILMGTRVGLLAVGLLAACSSSSDATAARARQDWASTKGGCPRYHYAVTTSSFTGYQTTTTVEIDGDQPAMAGAVWVLRTASQACPPEKLKNFGTPRRAERARGCSTRAQA